MPRTVCRNAKMGSGYDLCSSLGKAAGDKPKSKRVSCQKKRLSQEKSACFLGSAVSYDIMVKPEHCILAKVS
jgi:hypothetical protein